MMDIKNTCESYGKLSKSREIRICSIITDKSTSVVASTEQNK